MQITVFADLSGRSATEYGTTFPGFCDWLRSLPEQLSKQCCPLVKLGSFGDQRTAADSVRHDANMLSIDGVECDYDDGHIAPDQALAILQATGLQAVVVTTPSHTPQTPRWRAYLPTSATLSPEERHALVGRVNTLFGGTLANESFTRSQAFYVGPVTGVEYQVLVSDAQGYIDQATHLPVTAPSESQGAGAGGADPLAMVTKRAQSLDQVAAALASIPNDEPDWERWNKIGMAVYVASGGSDEGMRLWDEWSQRCPGRHTDSAHKRWMHFHRSPPTNIGMGTLVQLAGGRSVTAPIPPAPSAAPVPNDMGEGLGIGSGWAYYAIPWLDAKQNGKPKATITNLRLLLEQACITTRYNLMTKEPEITIPGARFLRNNAQNNAMAVIMSLCNTVEFPTGNVPEFIVSLASEKPYHPVKLWIESRPWDGRDRLPGLIDSLDPVNRPAAEMLLPKWLASGIDAVMSSSGVSTQGCLVLQGPQNAGKTRWLKSLVGEQIDAFKEGAILNPADKDSVKQSIKYWITELGELDATFRRADISALKSFLTRKIDEFRSPFERTESTHPRQTIFAASVNPQAFLHDDTGNRRYWTIEIGSNMTADHGIDMRQVWSQIAETRRSITIWLNDDELQFLNDVNSEFETPSTVEELIRENYCLKAIRCRSLTATEILEEIGLDASRFNSRSAASAVAKVFGRSRKSNGMMVYNVPVKLTKAGKAFRRDA